MNSNDKSTNIFIHLGFMMVILLLIVWFVFVFSLSGCDEKKKLTPGFDKDLQCLVYKLPDNSCVALCSESNTRAYAGYGHGYSFQIDCKTDSPF